MTRWLSVGVRSHRPISVTKPPGGDDDVDRQREQDPRQDHGKNRDLEDRGQRRGQARIGFAGDGDVALLAHPAHLQPERDQCQCEQNHRQRRGIAEVIARADDGEKDLDRQHLVAATQHDGVAEIGQAFDEGQQEGSGKTGAQERPCDLAEGGHGSRAQCARGFLQRGIDRLERGQQDKEGHGRKGQNLRDQDARQAVDPAGRPHLHQVGDKARDKACAPEKQDDGDAHDKRGRDDRQDGNGAKRPLHPEIGAVYQKCQSKAQRGRKGRRQHTQNHGVGDDTAAPRTHETGHAPKIGRRNPGPEGGQRQHSVGIDEGRDAKAQDREEDKQGQKRDDSRDAEGRETFPAAKTARREQVRQKPRQCDPGQKAAPAKTGLTVTGLWKHRADPIGGRAAQAHSKTLPDQQQQRTQRQAQRERRPLPAPRQRGDG